MKPRPVWQLMSGHPTVAVNGIAIDERMASLIALLWRDGYTTRACCQGCRPRDLTASERRRTPSAAVLANVVFESIEDGVRFLEHMTGVLKAAAPDCGSAVGAERPSGWASPRLSMMMPGRSERPGSVVAFYSEDIETLVEHWGMPAEQVAAAWRRVPHAVGTDR